MRKIVIDSKIPYIKGVLEPYFEVVYLDGNAISPSEALGASALIVRTRTVCNKSLLEGSSVECIATATIGYDHIDIEYCKEAGIDVYTSAGCNASGVVQYVIAAIYASKRSPDTTTVGIIGCGNVGGLLSKTLRKLGFKVLCSDAPRRDNGNFNEHIDIDELVSKSDIITFHTPLIKDGCYKTYHLASGSLFSRAKEGVMIINSSRGEVVDTLALIDAIKSKKVCCSAIDVWEEEPNINTELLGMVDIATAHIAGYTRKGKERGTEIAVQHIASKFNIDELKQWKIGSMQLDLIDLEVSESGSVADKNSKWREITDLMPQFFDIKAQTSYLKSHKMEFEEIRGNYLYRKEYF